MKEIFFTWQSSFIFLTPKDFLIFRSHRQRRCAKLQYKIEFESQLLNETFISVLWAHSLYSNEKMPEEVKKITWLHVLIQHQTKPGSVRSRKRPLSPKVLWSFANSLSAFLWVLLKWKKKNKDNQTKTTKWWAWFLFLLSLKEMAPLVENSDFHKYMLDLCDVTA